MHEQWIWPRGSLLEAELGREIVGLSVEKGTCFGFNETASAVWRHLREPTRKQDLISALLENFDVDPETYLADVDFVLERLAALELIELETRPAPIESEQR